MPQTTLTHKTLIMKKRSTKYLLATGVIAVAAAFTACSMDHDDRFICPPGAEGITGMYDTKLTLGLVGRDSTLNASVRLTDVLAFRPFPLIAVLEQVVKISPNSTSYNELSNLTFFSNYTVKQTADSVLISIPPSMSEIRFDSDGTSHIVRLTIGGDGHNGYSIKDQTLNLRLRATDVWYNNAKVTDFQDVIFTIKDAMRRPKEQ